MNSLLVVLFLVGSLFFLAGCWCHDREYKDRMSRARGALEEGHPATAAEILKGEKK